MNSKEFRKAGKDVIDWIADYYEKISEFPVMSQVKANEIRDDLPNDIPIEGESFECIMKPLAITQFLWFFSGQCLWPSNTW